MSVLIPVVSKGITFREVPNKIAVYFEIGGCIKGCKGCHSEHLQLPIQEPMSLARMVQYADKQVDAGANAIVILGGTTNRIAYDDLIRMIEALANIAPVCLYSGSDDDSLHMKLITQSSLTWLKTGSYQEDLGGLQAPTTNQRFYKRNIKVVTDGGHVVTCSPLMEDITDSFFLPTEEV